LRTARLSSDLHMPFFEPISFGFFVVAQKHPDARAPHDPTNILEPRIAQEFGIPPCTRRVCRVYAVSLRQLSA